MFENPAHLSLPNYQVVHIYAKMFGPAKKTVHVSIRIHSPCLLCALWRLVVWVRSGLSLRAVFFGAAIALQFFAFDYFKALLKVRKKARALIASALPEIHIHSVQLPSALKPFYRNRYLQRSVKFLIKQRSGSQEKVQNVHHL